jgi:predicted DNA-binding protein
MAPRPTDTVVISTRLPEGMPERIDQVAGPGNRAAFIREAIERLLSEYEGNSAAYLLERMEKPNDKWEGLLRHWLNDHREQQAELEEVKIKLDALADFIIVQFSPSTGKSRFKNAWALEFKKYIDERLKRHAAHDEETD